MMFFSQVLLADSKSLRVIDVKMAVLFVFGFILLAGCGGTKKAAGPEDLSHMETAPQESQLTPYKEEIPLMEESAKKPAELVLKTAFFDYDKSELRSDTRKVLQENASMLQAYPGVTVLIEGHCDERGTIEYNLALGDRRARAVKDYLVDLGVLPERLSTISYGKERPVDPRQNEQAYAKNRRAEFVINRRIASN